MSTGEEEVIAKVADYVSTLQRESYARGVAEERARVTWLFHRQRLLALCDDEPMSAAHLRAVEIHVEAGTNREDVATVPDPR